jgi:hypothetical protein
LTNRKGIGATGLILSMDNIARIIIFKALEDLPLIRAA